MNAASSASVENLSSDTSTSQAVRAQVRLRDLIFGGELPGGARIAELALVERLGVSRTPIRAALIRLEQEGLLEALPSGGYAVRTLSERDVSDAIELRGTVEGLAARLAAERGAPPVVLREARQCLRDIDALLQSASLTDEGFANYVELNASFHQRVAEMAGSNVLMREIERVSSLPFASPSAFAGIKPDFKQERDMLRIAQDQHWQVLDAISNGEGTRAEALMREHSKLAQRNLRSALQDPSSTLVRGVRLIRKH